MLSSFVIWNLATILLFHYIVNVLHPDQGFGEPIWVIDPIGFMIISVPTGLVFFLGLIAFFRDMLPGIMNKPNVGKTAGVV
jgi:hypothetical protein